jgi:hypothetical protein
VDYFDRWWPNLGVSTNGEVGRYDLLLTINRVFDAVPAVPHKLKKRKCFTQELGEWVVVPVLILYVTGERFKPLLSGSVSVKDFHYFEQLLNRVVCLLNE